MEQFYILDGFEVNIEMEQVLDAIDCRKDNPAYEEVVTEYQEICEAVQALVEPKGIMGFGKLTEQVATEEYPVGTPVVYAVLSVGDKCENYATKAFREGNYVRGMLCDAIADNALFSLEGRMLEQLKMACREHNVGIVRRLEAPHDIPMEVQRQAWDFLQLHKRFGIGISSGYMFNPIKTYCQVFVLTDDVNEFRAQHDCSKCTNVACKYRATQSK